MAESNKRTEHAKQVAAGKLVMLVRAQRLTAAGYTNVAIADKLGIHESSVRRLLKPSE